MDIESSTKLIFLLKMYLRAQKKCNSVFFVRVQTHNKSNDKTMYLCLLCMSKVMTKQTLIKSTKYLLVMQSKIE